MVSGGGLLPFSFCAILPRIKRSDSTFARILKIVVYGRKYFEIRLDEELRRMINRSCFINIYPYKTTYLVRNEDLFFSRTPSVDRIFYASVIKKR